jgi:hypothetical protein
VRANDAHPEGEQIQGGGPSLLVQRKRKPVEVVCRRCGMFPMNVQHVKSHGKPVKLVRAAFPSTEDWNSHLQEIPTWRESRIEEVHRFDAAAATLLECTAAHIHSLRARLAEGEGCVQRDPQGKASWNSFGESPNVGSRNDF